jgi:hypothetical protein
MSMFWAIPPIPMPGLALMMPSAQTWAPPKPTCFSMSRKWVRTALKTTRNRLNTWAGVTCSGCVLVVVFVVIENLKNVAKSQSEYYFKLFSAVAIEQKLRLAKNVSALSENVLWVASSRKTIT